MYNNAVFSPKQLVWQPAKFLVQKFLEILVRVKLARIQPKIIGITGSFGKTSTKDAVYEVLKTRWRVYKNPKSLNTEFGLALAVLGQLSGFSSATKWLYVLARAIINAFFSCKYDFMILEYGADKPGDIAHLVRLVRPHIAIITHITQTHQAEGQFANEKEVFNEKKKLAESLDAAGIAILNADDKWLQKLRGKLKAKIFWFSGKKSASDKIWAADNKKQTADILCAMNLQNDSTGFSATICMAFEKIPAYFPIAGSFHINIFLPALLCGVLNGITLREGIRALSDFKLPAGRMSIIPGQGDATLLDSSYNASPETVAEALALLKDFPGKRKIAVLGNMNELGAYTEEAHRRLAQHIDLWLGLLITVGENAALIGDEALKKGFPKSKIKFLLNAGEAAKFLLENLEGGLRKGDVILLKGSQNRVRLERAVKMLMLHPEEAERLLCRQEPEWKKID